MEKGHQYRGFGREGQEINSARAALRSRNHKETKPMVCLSWNGGIFFF